MRLRATALCGLALAVLAACEPIADPPPQPRPIRAPVVEPGPVEARPRPIPAPRPSRRPPPDGMPFERPRPGESADRCGAAYQQHLIGRSWPQTLPRNMTRVRVIEAGMPVTMDYHADRVNIELNRDGRTIRRIWCG